MAADMMKLWLWPLEAFQATARVMETSAASQSVIGARLPMISHAMSNPLSANHSELSRMVTEKVEAFGRSQRVLAVAGQEIRRAGHANAAAFGRLAGGIVLGPADWMSMFERNLSLAATLMTLPTKAMAPIHRGATANARRLRVH